MTICPSFLSLQFPDLVGRWYVAADGCFGYHFDNSHWLRVGLRHDFVFTGFGQGREQHSD